jgi:hypothetical protein
LRAEVEVAGQIYLQAEPLSTAAAVEAVPQAGLLFLVETAEAARVVME